LGARLKVSGYNALVAVPQLDRSLITDIASPRAPARIRHSAQNGPEISLEHLWPRGGKGAGPRRPRRAQRGADRERLT